MRLIRLLTGALVITAFAGCQEPNPAGQPMGVDEFLVRSYGDDAIRNAIIVQGAVFPYHFVCGTPTLNGLGEYDVSVLAEHLRDYPGRIKVIQGDADRALYEQRVSAVAELLSETGLDVSRVQVGASLPGGDGLPSRRVVEVLEAGPSAQAAGQPAQTTYVTQVGTAQGSTP